MADSFVFFLNCFVTLFSILDPFGAAAVLLALTHGASEEARAAQTARAIKTTVIVLFVFTVAGGAIFALFGISVQALKVAGGLILIQMAFRMLEGSSPVRRDMKSECEEAENKEDIAVIPLAIPILSGPAAITAVIVFANKAQGAAGWAMLISAIGLALFLTFLILRQSDKLAVWLGDTGMRIMTRIMGLILMAMGIEFVLSALHAYFSGAATPGG